MTMATMMTLTMTTMQRQGMKQECLDWILRSDLMMIHGTRYCPIALILIIAYVYDV